MNRAQRRMEKKQMRSAKPEAQPDVDALATAATQYYTTGQFSKAEEVYLKIIALRPDWAEAQSNLGVILQQQGKLTEAGARYQRALELLPDSAMIHYNLANTFKKLGKSAEAIAHYEKALALNPGDAEVHNNLGVTLKHLDKFDEAAQQYRKALQLKPAYAEAHNNLANLLKDQGDFEEAKAHYERAFALDPGYTEAYHNYANLVKFRPDDAILMVLKTLASDIRQLPEEKRIYLHFALAKALDDTGDYAGAFEHMAQGNALKRQNVRYDEAVARKFFRQITEAFTADVFDRFHESGDPSSTPIFVVGMPRSGTTLVEQVLASHPDVYGAGELDLMDRLSQHIPSYPASVSGLNTADLQMLGETYLKNLPALPQGKNRITDKRPLNFFHIGLIRLILPNARIIHVMRDPADTCLSCYSKLFAANIAFSYNLAELGRFYRRYHELMAHWRAVLPHGSMLDVRYEDMVANPEEQTRRLLDYCNLPWDERCLRFHETSRNVTTASAVQVRQPLFKSALNRRQHYEANLQPLLDELPHPAKTA